MHHNGACDVSGNCTVINTKGMMMINAVVKHSVYNGGQSVVLGRYLDLKDKLQTIEFMGDTSEAQAKLETMRRAGYEFQLVTIHEL